jgi:hypothetical protein
MELYSHSPHTSPLIVCRLGDGWKDTRPNENGVEEIACGNVDWIELAQDRIQWLAHVNTVMNLWV